MAITYEVESWLRDQGQYENHCFISWPHTDNRDITDCARRIRESIREALALSFVNPAVFLDETGLRGGAIWDPALRRALCRSVSMVAICAPIYYRPEHLWCGLEWAAMQQLSSNRLPSVELQAIIPVMVRKSTPLPSAVSKVHCSIDISRVTLQGRRFFASQEFRAKVNEIVNLIEQIAMELYNARSRANCEMFEFPTVSAFAEYAPPAQAFPILT